MMPPPQCPQPTDAELEVLHVLWRRGPSTVKQVHETLLTQRTLGYTTVLKTMQIMGEKDLVSRNTDNRAHIYRARLTRKRLEKGTVSAVAARLFDGSIEQLAMKALQSSRLSDTELIQIRALLDRHREPAATESEDGSPKGGSR